MGPGEQVYQIRKDLSDFLSSGLDKLDRERVKEISQALGELNLAKPAQMVTALLDQTDPTARFEQFVKTIQALRQVELRLVRLDQTPAGDLVEIPMYGGLYLERSRLPDKNLDLAWITALPDRFARDYALAEYLNKVDDQTMSEQMEYLWGNASLTPLVVNRLKDQPDQALALVAQTPNWENKIIYYTALELCQAIGTEAAYQAMKKLPIFKPRITGPLTPDEESLIKESTGYKELGLHPDHARMAWQVTHQHFPTGWEWLGFHLLQAEATTFRPQLLNSFQAMIRHIMTDSAEGIKGLGASRKGTREEGIDLVSRTGYPALIPVLREALERETVLLLKYEIIDRLAGCGDLALVEEALAFLSSQAPEQEPKLREAYALAAANLGDVRAKKILIEEWKNDRRLMLPRHYGRAMLPEILELCQDPTVAIEGTYIAHVLLSHRTKFPEELVLEQVEKIMAQPITGVKLGAMLFSMARYCEKNPAGLAMVTGHALMQLQNMESAEQKQAVALLVLDPSYTPLIVEAWNDLAEEARLQALAVFKAPDKKNKKAKPLKESYPASLRPAAAALANLLCDWKNEQAEEGLLKAAADSPDFFIALGDEKIIVLCLERLQNGPPSAQLPALAALGALGVEQAIPAINAMPATNAKMKKAVEQALARIEQNKDLRPPKAFSASRLGPGLLR
jgi:hypothetical protein